MLPSLNNVFGNKIKCRQFTSVSYPTRPAKHVGQFLRQKKEEPCCLRTNVKRWHLRSHEPQTEQPLTEGLNFKKTVWTIIDVVAIFGSVGGALAALLGLASTTYALLLPLVLPVVSLVAALQREGLIAEKNQWQYDRLSFSLQRESNVLLDEARGAIEEVRRELRNQSTASTKLAAIDARLSSLEGSVLSTSRASRSAAAGLTGLNESFTAAQQNIVDSVISSIRVELRKEAEARAAQDASAGVAGLNQALASAQQAIVEAVVTDVRAELQQEAAERIGESSASWSRLDDRLGALENRLVGLELAQSEGSSMAVTVAMSEWEESLYKAVRNEISVSLEPVRRLPAILAAALPAMAARESGGSAVDEALLAEVNATLEGQLSAAVQQILEGQAAAAASPLSASLSQEQWEALGQRLTRLESMLQASAATTAAAVVQQLPTPPATAATAEMLEQLIDTRLTSTIRTLEQGMNVQVQAVADGLYTKMTERVDSAVAALEQRIPEQVAGVTGKAAEGLYTKMTDRMDSAVAALLRPKVALEPWREELLSNDKVVQNRLDSMATSLLSVTEAVQKMQDQLASVTPQASSGLSVEAQGLQSNIAALLEAVKLLDEKLTSVTALSSPATMQQQDTGEVASSQLRDLEQAMAGVTGAVTSLAERFSAVESRLTPSQVGNATEPPAAASGTEPPQSLPHANTSSSTSRPLQSPLGAEPSRVAGENPVASSLPGSSQSMSADSRERSTRNTSASSDLGALDHLAPSDQFYSPMDTAMSERGIESPEFDARAAEAYGRAPERPDAANGRNPSASRNGSYAPVQMPHTAQDYESAARSAELAGQWPGRPEGISSRSPSPTKGFVAAPSSTRLPSEEYNGQLDYNPGTQNPSQSYPQANPQQYTSGVSYSRDSLPGSPSQDIPQEYQQRPARGDSPGWAAEKVQREYEMQPLEGMETMEKVAEGLRLLRLGRAEVARGGDLGVADKAIRGALVALQSAVAADPSDARALGNLGNALLAAGELKRAYLDSLMAGPPPISSDDMEAQRNSEAALRAEISSLLTSAGEMFRSVVQIEGWSNRALVNWGRAMVGRAELGFSPEASKALYQAAVDKFEAVLTEQPDMWPAKFRCALALRGLAETEVPGSRRWVSLVGDALSYLRELLSSRDPDAATLREPAAVAAAELQAALRAQQNAG